VKVLDAAEAAGIARQSDGFIFFNLGDALGRTC